MAFSFKQRRKIPCAGATVNISLLCAKKRHKSVTFMSLICQRIVNLYRSKNKQIIIKFLR
ncbi:glyceraldehyde-3-phosphate dehydrogenase [Enterobacter cloacae subsp. cloacae]|uniref:Glyceraldehyde-3-phosphate dehydrogenase n=1 Tax=Enterobacter cloacae subsp. cloacae TaxID=336306 RepID=A0AAE2JMS2_ENTCL|nr:glyceraldehyde-3-phosphate dehydrogenase [Enterobacter cloacae]KJM27059.1 glyceraldehyde-3-phosphate dehydrogenase [Enterobacter cloacae subsp. cloacae]KSY76258.1 glyceraldehyde-3-phosphate dehydrogenase [Enterobacter sp. 50793107]KYQ76064.1 glyceraldehyde-3-phosphate dehydrogenase [Enterobacter sp. SENG-6]PPV38013.1 glyceraldehyde-3-phosphate dehydrogenase [Enterobacter sp. RC4]